MIEDIPDWAMKRAEELYHKNRSDFALEAFARYISEHEQPPVDPDLIEARRIAANIYQLVGLDYLAGAARGGFEDSHPSVQSALQAIKTTRANCERLHRDNQP